MEVAPDRVFALDPEPDYRRVRPLKFLVLGITALVSQTVTALRTIGTAMWTVLQDLLNYIISLVKTALAPVIDPILTLDVSYSDALANATTAAEATMVGGSISRTAALNFWSAFGGSIFEIAFAMAIAVDLVIALLIPFSLGAGFLIGAALSIAFTAAMQSMKNQELTQASSLGQYSTLNSGLSLFVESATNTSAHKPQGSNQSFWSAFGSALGWAATLFSFQISTMLLAYAWVTHTEVAWQTAGFVLGVVSLLLSLGAVITGNKVVKDLAIGTSGVGVALDTYSFVKDSINGADPYIYTLDGTVLLLDTSALAVSWFIA